MARNGPDALTMKVGARLTALRVAKGFTRHELSKLAGCSHLTIADIEKGASSAEVTTLSRIARALGVRPIDLLNVNDNVDGAIVEAMRLRPELLSVARKWLNVFVN